MTLRESTATTASQLSFTSGTTAGRAARISGLVLESLPAATTMSTCAAARSMLRWMVSG